jgi:DNA polymerase II small subunit/DNA polymerase delta subunit B
MVCIPKFSETGQAILVNMETLNVQVLEFDDGMEQ